MSRNKLVTIDSLIEELGIANNECVEIIGVDQRDQIVSLQKEVESLKREIEKRDELIEILRKKLNNTSSVNTNRISKIMHYIHPSDNINENLSVDSFFESLEWYFSEENQEKLNLELKAKIVKNERNKMSKKLKQEIEHNENQLKKQYHRDLDNEILQKEQSCLSDLKNVLLKHSGVVHDGDTIDEIISGFMIHQNKQKEQEILDFEESLAKQDGKISENYDLTDSYKMCRMALAKNPKEYSMKRFINSISELTQDVILIRDSYCMNHGALSSYVFDMANQIQHLDQLHTQTRSLLVRQSQVISELRANTEESWKDWAYEMYGLISGDNETELKQNDMKVYLEEEIISLISKMGKRKKPTTISNSPPEHIPSPKKSV